MPTEQAKPIVSRLEAFITEELTAPDLDSLYDDMLDECYSFKQVGGPFANMLPSRVLREVDPIAYRCGFNDWADEDYVEVGGEMYDKREVKEKKEEFLDEIRSEILDLEEEIEEREAELTEAEGDEEEIKERKARLEELPPSGATDSEIISLAEQLKAFDQYRASLDRLGPLRTKLAHLNQDLYIAERHCF